MKYFFYLSEPKLDMLHSQLKSASAPKMSRKYKLGVPGTGAEFSFTPVQPNVYKKLAKVLNWLDGKGLISHLAEDELIRQELYYEDEGDWHNGLFAISHFKKTIQIETYALMRQVGKNLVLLIGSPNNILGNVDSISDLRLPGTSLGIMAFLSIFSSNNPKRVDLQDEFQPAFKKGRDITDYDMCHQRNADEFHSFFGLTWPAEKPLDQNSRIRMMMSFCREYVAALPLTRIECVFKVFATWPVEPDRRENSDEGGLSNEIASLSIGSPLYTAIP